MIEQEFVSKCMAIGMMLAGEAGRSRRTLTSLPDEVEAYEIIFG